MGNNTSAIISRLIRLLKKTLDIMVFTEGHGLLLVVRNYSRNIRIVINSRNSGQEALYGQVFSASMMGYNGKEFMLTPDAFGSLLTKCCYANYSPLKFPNYYKSILNCGFDILTSDMITDLELSDKQIVVGLESKEQLFDLIKTVSDQKVQIVMIKDENLRYLVEHLPFRVVYQYQHYYIHGALNKKIEINLNEIGFIIPNAKKVFIVIKLNNIHDNKLCLYRQLLSSIPKAQEYLRSQRQILFDIYQKSKDNERTVRITLPNKVLALYRGKYLDNEELVKLANDNILSADINVSPFIYNYVSERFVDKICFKVTSLTIKQIMLK